MLIYKSLNVCFNLAACFSGRSPFLCMNLGTQTIIFSDFDKLVSFLEAQVSFLT